MEGLDVDPHGLRRYHAPEARAAEFECATMEDAFAEKLGISPELLQKEIREPRGSAFGHSQPAF